MRASPSSLTRRAPTQVDHAEAEACRVPTQVDHAEAEVGRVPTQVDRVLFAPGDQKTKYALTLSFLKQF